MVAFLYRSGKNSKNELKNKPVKANNGSPEKKKIPSKKGDPGFGNDHFQVLYVKLGGGVTIK